MSRKIKITKTDIKEAIQDAFQNFALNESIEEGIDFDEETREVSYNPSHEENVDTSIENNPTFDTSLVPNVKVWSIFKRKKGNHGDGNPLIYALKNEGWKFKTPADKTAILKQFDKIATKFASMYSIGLTIVVPSGNSLNDYITSLITSKSKNAEVIDGVVCKMTTEEVEHIILYDDNCKFRLHYKNNFKEAYHQLRRYLEKMVEERNGYFSRHYIKNKEMRDVLDFTFKTNPSSYAEFANKINGQDVLVIDDTISRGQSISEVCKIIRDTYAPKSITVLTLMSSLK